MADPARLRFWGWVGVWCFGALVAVSVAAIYWGAPEWISTVGFLSAMVIVFAAGGVGQRYPDGTSLVSLEAGGLDVTAWNVGPVVWRDIADVRATRKWVVVALKDPDAYLVRTYRAQAFFMKLFASFGRGPFAIETTLLDAGPEEIAEAIRERLV